MSDSRLPLVVIAGPTGVGKTETALYLSGRIPLELISADSRQVYRRMDIGTGKPTPTQRRAVRHHLLDRVEPDEPYHAARFRRESQAEIQEIRDRGRLPVIVGGTGLYIRALLRGLRPAPARHQEFREELVEWARGKEAGALHRRLARVNPEVARRIHPKDKVRIIRAIEIDHYQNESSPLILPGADNGAPSPEADGDWGLNRPPFHLLMVGLTMPRAALARSLASRVEAMVARGLREEVQALLEAGYDESLSAMNGIGYRHYSGVLCGRTTEAEAIRAMKRDTIRYAKRQWTWFRKEPELRWMDLQEAGGPEGTARAIARLIQEGGYLP
ncbi:MAG: tRNA (adenosine(37)-N6)-dimethylallyltransferase MiaA [Candidatus Methylomirabilia bacterium]